MPKIDKVKEFIGWLKVVFGILVATEISLIGWLASSYKNLDIFLIVLSVVTALLVALGIIYTNKKAMQNINDLENL